MVRFAHISLVCALAVGCWPYLSEPYSPDTAGDGGAASTRVGAFGALRRSHYVGGGWGSGGGERVDLQWALIKPKDIHWWQLYSDERDACRSDHAGPGFVVDDLGVASTTLVVEGNDYTIPNAGGGTYAASLDVEAFSSGSTYKMSVGDSVYGTFAIEDFVRAPSVFTLTLPHLDSVDPTPIGLADLEFRWLSTDADVVVIELILWNDSTNTQIERVTCAAEDDGIFDVPSSAFQRWKAGLTLYVTVGSVLEGEGTVEPNGGRSAVAGFYRVLAVAETQ